MDLRWYQKEAVQSIWAAICRQDGKHSLCVLPTGSGKSLVIAEIARRIVKCGKKLIVLAHRKELLEQNAAALRRLAPGVSVGVYSAGLGKRETTNDVIVCGIASVYSKAHIFDERVLTIIDEAHLVPNKSFGMYRSFLNDVVKLNQTMQIIGLTATPFRLQDGPLCDGDIFDEIVYSAPMRRLIDEGYLSRIYTPEHAVSKVDISGVKTRAREFMSGDLEAAYTHADVLDRTVSEIVAHTADRKSVLIFCSGVMHAEAVCDKFRTGHSIGCELVVGETLDLDRVRILRDFRGGRIKYLCNVEVLTTGFDAPNVDCVAVLRATQSAGLFAQIVGRGLRVADGKDGCLVLDFGGNIDRHGPIDSEEYGMISDRRSKGDGKDAEEKDRATKLCTACQNQQPLSVLYCEDCGARFDDPDVTHDSAPAVGAELLGNATGTFGVLGWTLQRNYGKEGKRDTLRIVYEINATWPNTVSEWVCCEHDGWARSKAVIWWSEHCKILCPLDIDECIELWQRGALRAPKEIRCKKDGKYWSVIGRTFEDERPNVEDFTPAEEIERPLSDYDISEIPF